MRFRVLQPISTASWTWQRNQIVTLDLEFLAADEQAEVDRYVRDGILEPIEEPEEDGEDDGGDVAPPPAKPGPTATRGARLPKGPRRG